MLRRFVPIVLAMALAFAPVALEACQASCAVHDALSAATAAPGHPAAHRVAAPSQPGNGHSCHEITMPASDTAAASHAMAGGPHSCAHLDELPPSAGAGLHVSLTPPAVVASILGVSPASRLAPPIADVDAASISARIVLTTQQRV
jgi:hypothetical protein